MLAACALTMYERAAGHGMLCRQGYWGHSCRGVWVRCCWLHLCQVLCLLGCEAGEPDCSRCEGGLTTVLQPHTCALQFVSCWLVIMHFCNKACSVAAASCYFLKTIHAVGVKDLKGLSCLFLQGVVHAGREDLTQSNYLSEVAVDTPMRTLKEAISGSDVFLGLSVSRSPFATARVKQCC
eukprot:GHRR01037388.1.p1 GENE.GHRR01037388.1~~GHRR01037388.1.p1  ORF type:complete len:180 (-),score=28.60 GHRR01037388.1:368-907(-)